MSLSELPASAFFFRASGGGALLSIQPPGSERLSGVIPHVSAGVGFDVYPIPMLGIGLDLGFAAYFESTFLIAGFTPALRLTLRL